MPRRLAQQRMTLSDLEWSSTLKSTSSALRAISAVAELLVTNTWRREHIMPVLRQSHWLSVAYDIVLYLSWPYWFTQHWMACFLSTVQMTASLSLRPAADEFDRPTSIRARFQELRARTAQVGAINLSLLLTCYFRTAYVSTYAILNSPYWNSASCWKRTCLADDRRA